LNDYFVRTLPYSPDSSLLLRRLAELPGLIMLDSGLRAMEHPPGLGARHDILSALPREVLAQSLPGRRLTPSLFRQESLYSSLSACLLKHAPEQPLPEALRGLPFVGGALGYVGYDGDSRFGIHDWAIVVDHHKQTSLLFALPGCLDATLQAVLACLEQPLPALPGFTLETGFVSNFTPHTYASAFAQVQDYIQAGDCYQVNLAQRFAARFAGDPLGAYLQLRGSIRSPFSAFIRHADSSVLCFSPERFLEVRGEQVLTQPIKGTRRRSPDPVQDAALAQELQSSDKDRAENLMIVDLLRNDLGSLCRTGSVQVDKLFELQSFSNVHHLVSTIRGLLPASCNAVDLLRSCFPGGSITGAPKQRSMEIIAQLEPDARRVYCGSAGYVGFDGQMDTNIMIRTLLCEGQDMYCWGGGGLVADSVCSQEYQECFDKINNIINVLK
jgi:para-aminobenzoate synthetase component 1